MFVALPPPQHNHLWPTSILKEKRTFRFQMRGQAIVTNVERDMHMVDDLLALKEEVDSVVSESFGRSEKFRNATKDAFEAFINKRQNKPAECVGALDIMLIRLLFIGSFWR